MGGAGVEPAGTPGGVLGRTSGTFAREWPQRALRACFSGLSCRRRMDEGSPEPPGPAALRQPMEPENDDRDYAAAPSFALEPSPSFLHAFARSRRCAETNGVSDEPTLRLRRSG